MEINITKRIIKFGDYTIKTSIIVDPQTQTTYQRIFNIIGPKLPSIIALQKGGHQELPPEYINPKIQLTGNGIIIFGHNIDDCLKWPLRRTMQNKY